MLSLLKPRCALSLFLLAMGAMAQQPAAVPAPHDKIWPRVPANLVKLPAGTPRSMVGGYWRIDADRKATIYLKNSLEIAPLTVTPILYLSNGARYPLDPVTLAESGTASLSVNEALARKGISPWATLSGYVEVDYTWAWDPVCVTVTSVDPVHSVVFSYTLQPSVVPPRLKQGMANEMRGMWWKPESGVTGFVALSNTTDRSIQAQVALTGSDDGNLSAYAVTVSPHGTKTIHLAALDSLPAGAAGGLHVAAEGLMGGLVLYGGLEDKSAGYSATLPFHFDAVDKSSAALKTEIYAEPGLMTGAADPMMLFPADTAFRPFSVAQNVSDAPVVVTPSIYWMKGGTARTARLPSVTLAPGETANLDTAAALSQAGLSAFNGTFTMTVESQGKRHALLLASGSVDLKNTYVFQVVPRMVKKSLSKSLSYWSTANGDDTMVTVWNPADEAQDYRFTVNFDGGRYRLPIHLEARATRNFNISELIQSQIPDDEGNVIPLGVREGSAKISGIHADNESILVAVDGGVYNARKATCWYYCIECSGAEFAALVAEPLYVKKGGQATLDLVTTDNNGNTYGAPAASWSSTNASVASINGVEYDSNLTVTGNAVGSATFSATSAEIPIYSSYYCAYDAECPDEGYTEGSGSGNVEPFSLLTVTPSSLIVGAVAKPLVITGSGFTKFPGSTLSITFSGLGISATGSVTNDSTITGTYTVSPSAKTGPQSMSVMFATSDGSQGGSLPVSVVLPTISLSQNLSLGFFGAGLPTPANFYLYVSPVTFTVAGAASGGSFAWSLPGAAKATFASNGTSSVSTSTSAGSVQLYGYGPSASLSDQSIKVVWTSAGGDSETTSAAFTVYAPYKLISTGITGPLAVSACAPTYAAGNIGWHSIYYWQMFDQFGHALTGMSLNENFSNIVQYQSTNLTYNPNGSPGVAGQSTFHDDYCYANNTVGKPPPEPPQNPLTTNKIDSATQTYKLGSGTVGSGVSVQTQTLTRYVDHPTVTNIVSPVP